LPEKAKKTFEWQLMKRDTMLSHVPVKTGDFNHTALKKPDLKNTTKCPLKTGLLAGLNQGRIIFFVEFLVDKTHILKEGVEMRFV